MITYRNRTFPRPKWVTDTKEELIVRHLSVQQEVNGRVIISKALSAFGRSNGNDDHYYFCYLCDEHGFKRKRLKQKSSTSFQANMNQCPSYYLLADGREFVDWFSQEYGDRLNVLTRQEYHCLQSAMEHLFRMGAKPNQVKHDKKAAAFWLSKLMDFHNQQDARFQIDAMTLGNIISTVEADVMAERAKLGR